MVGILYISSSCGIKRTRTEISDVMNISVFIRCEGNQHLRLLRSNPHSQPGSPGLHVPAAIGSEF